MSVPEQLAKLFKKIDEHKLKFIENLSEAVAFQSVSAWPQKRPECVKMINWTAEKLRNLGATVELKDIGTQKISADQEIPLTPVLFGHIKSGGALTNKKLKTILVYCHLDVQPALKEDGWNSEPFILTEVEGKLYGRGSSDDKGPALGWLHAIQCYRELNIELPINIKFIFEGMEESGSVGLDRLLENEKEGFLKDVDFVVITDSRWLGPTKPCITYGLRGVCYFFIEVECASKDLHSGSFGGSVPEAMTDLIYLFNQLVTRDGEILIPNIYKDVASLTEKERTMYEKIEFDIEKYRKEVGCNKLIYNEKEDILMHRWRQPSLSIHGIHGAFSEPGSKTVIPGSVTGKFSIRTVPNQEANTVEKYVVDYLNQKWKEYGSPNKMKVYMSHSGPNWTENPDHPQYRAAAKVTKYVYGVEPDLIREGSTVPVTFMLQEATGKNVLILPIGSSDDGAHADNEKINIRNYIEGTKLLAAYIHEVGQL